MATSTTTPTTTFKDPPPLRVGVLIHSPVQLLDLSPIDLFGMLTKLYLQACQLPTPLVNLGIPVEIHYISSLPLPSSSISLRPDPLSSSTTSSPATTTATSSTSPLHAPVSAPPPPPNPSPQQEHPHLAPCTANLSLLLTTSIASPTVAPGALDVILIPGPDPAAEIPEAVGVWLRGHFEHVFAEGEMGPGGKKEGGKMGGGKEGGKGVTIMSVCTGIFVLAASGVLEGREATGPRAIVGELRRRWGGVRWVEGVRWVRSGGGDGGGREVWSSGGITNGLDMVAAYLREKYPGPLSDAVCMLANVGDRGREYRSGKVVDNGMWLWAIIRAWWAGA